MTAEEWVQAINEAATAFARSRGVAIPVLQLTLQDGEQLYVSRMVAGPGSGMLTIDVYPEDPETDMVPASADEDGVIATQTPRQLIAPVGFVAKVDLLAEAPPRGVGFWIRPES
jgi:hypothetical protein